MTPWAEGPLHMGILLPVSAPHPESLGLRVVIAEGTALSLVGILPPGHAFLKMASVINLVKSVCQSWPSASFLQALAL